MSHPLFKRAKILATIGPATNSYDAIKRLMLSGVNGFRLNFSHGNYEERTEQIAWIRKASQEVGKPVAILQDLQGPKIRLGNLHEHVQVQTGDELTLAYGAEHNGLIIPVQYNLAKKVKPGERLYIFDGKIRTTVLSIDHEAIKVRVENNGVLMSRKGINLPDTDFSGDILTEKDLRDIEYGARQDIDFVALSFVQTADDIKHLKRLLKQHNSQARIVAKIETKAAIEKKNLEAIVECVDGGVMIARGDLAVEAGAEVVPIVQRQILGLCQKYGKLSIVATQMMASMVDAPEPTRAEVSDVANAVILGADCVMLSDETANGKYPIEAVAAMKKVILHTQEHEPPQTVAVQEGFDDKQNAISAAAVQIAKDINADAIVAETKSGTTAANIAACRPAIPIISVTSSARVAQQMTLLYANKSFLRPDGEKAGSQLVVDLKKDHYFGTHEPVKIVVVSGRHPGKIGGTDTIRVRVF